MDDIKSLKEKIHHLKVLVVDDNDEFLEITYKFFKEVFDLVDKASSGKEALELYEQKGGYDIILSDVKMPGMGGWGLLRKLRGMNTEAFLVIMTGSSEEVDADKELCDILMPKPLGLESIINMFEKYVETKGL